MYSAVISNCQEFPGYRVTKAVYVIVQFEEMRPARCVRESETPSLCHLSLSPSSRDTLLFMLHCSRNMDTREQSAHKLRMIPILYVVYPYTIRCPSATSEFTIINPHNAQHLNHLNYHLKLTCASLFLAITKTHHLPANHVY